jgi:hypothetical protein
MSDLKTSWTICDQFVLPEPLQKKGTSPISVAINLAGNQGVGQHASREALALLHEDD